MGFVSRALRIQKSERSLTALVVALMFVATAAIAIGESGVEALFFNRIGSQSLPAMYVLQGSATLVAMLALTGILGRLGPRHAYLAAPLALAAVVLAERVLLLTGMRWVYFALWLTVALATLVQAVFLWGMANSVVDIRQAKRLFPIFGAGGILGAVAGGLLTRPLASAIGTQNVLFIWAGGLGITFALCRLVLGPPPAAERRRTRSQRASSLHDMSRVFTLVRGSQLLAWMAVAAVLFSIVFYLLYLPYAQAASERFRDADELAGFFGLFWAAGTGAAFLVSVFVTNRLLMLFGVGAIVIVLPVLYTTAFGMLLVEQGFVTLVALRFAVGVWLQGAASPGWEALYNVVPVSRRDETRAFINGGPMQIGTVLAGVIALVGQEVLSVRQLAAIGLVAAALAIAATIGIRGSYTFALVDALRAGRPQVFERRAADHTSIALALDADSARALRESAQSSDVCQRRLAVQLLAAARPSEVVGGIEDDDPAIRMVAIRALDLSTPASRDACVALAYDVDPAVAATAAARAIGVTDDTRVMSRLRALLADHDGAVRLAAAEQLALAPAEAAAVLASQLLSDPVADVRGAALERVVAAAPERGLQPALAGLQDPDPVVRMAAGRALGSLGGRGLEHILKALDDPQNSDAATEAVRNVQLNGDYDRVRSFVRSVAARAARDSLLAASIPPDDEAAALLHDAVLNRGRRVARSGLWAATMFVARRTEMETAIENLDGEPEQIANALETLETAGHHRLLRPLLAMWDREPPAAENKTWLSQLAGDEDEFIKRCAEFIRVLRGGRVMSDTATALSTIERILFLRNVRLFADLAPGDLERVAKLTEECGFADGEVIAAEGEAGDELHIVVEGTIRVMQGGDGSRYELARRTAGDPVGEMSLITRSPRIASLVADGPVRTIRLGHREFESMLRERPAIALALMRVLAQRLAENRHRAEIEQL